MTEILHQLVEQYGLAAVFLGCVAEGESAAIAAGFFAHQKVFVPWQALCAAFAGAFLGDAGFFMAGRHLSRLAAVRRMRTGPLFARAERMISAHPDLFVLTNRFAYGLRIAGGVAVGLSAISAPRFLLLNALSAALWASIFCGVGYVFGLGAEQIVGAALHRHQRVLVGLGIAIAVAIIGAIAAHMVRTRLAARAGAPPP